MVEISVGNKAPDFTLPDMERRPRRLDEFLGKKLMLAFFPGAFTSVCTKEMCALRDSMARLNELKAQVVEISANDTFSNKGSAERNLLTFPLLSDYSRKVIRLYGIELKDFAGLKGYSVAKRSIFILDENGVVRYRWVSDDLGVEPNYRELEDALGSIG